MTMRVAIVNDLAMAREALKRALAEEPGVSVAWTAADGAEAVAKTRADRPDLILMDLIMPGTDGVDATRQIMRDCPCAIVVVTATVEGNASRVYEAISAGALDAVDTPRVGERGGTRALLDKIERVRRMRKQQDSCCGPKTATPMRGAATTSAGAAAAAASTAAASTGAAAKDSGCPACATPADLCGCGADTGIAAPIVAIGASTGGPQALATVLRAMPSPAPFATIIVQHMGHGFLPGLATWLTERTGRAVRLARAGDVPVAGEVLIAGEAKHLVVLNRGTICFTEGFADLIHRPSVDVLFGSLARSEVAPGVAVLLTGMGRDGASQLLQLRKNGWTTIAQDQATSVVWGMPGAAAESGAATQVLPVQNIGAAVGAAMNAIARSGAVPARRPA